MAPQLNEANQMLSLQTGLRILKCTFELRNELSELRNEARNITVKSYLKSTVKCVVTRWWKYESDCLIGSTADQYQDRPADVLFCFSIPRYATYFDFSRQNTCNYTRPKFLHFTVASLYSCIRIINISQVFLQYKHISWRLTVNNFTGPRSTSTFCSSQPTKI